MTARRLFKRPLNYVLVNGKPVPEDNILAWADFYENPDLRIVRQDFYVYKNRGLVLIDEKTYEAAHEYQHFFRPLSAEEIEHNLKARKKKAELGGVPIKLSTIFLGIDHNWSDDGPPVLWETMMFGIDHNDFGQHRYDSAEKALAGHLLLLQTLMGLAKVGKLEKLLLYSDNGDEEEKEPGAVGSKEGS